MQMNNVDEPLAALEARIRVLEDKEAIRGVICSRGPACDTGLPEEAASIWTADGVLQSDLAHLEGPQDVKDMINSDAQQDLIRHGCAHVHGLPLGARAGRFWESLAIQNTHFVRISDRWHCRGYEWKVVVGLGSLNLFEGLPAVDVI
jgi:hypothetical protein